MAASDKPVKEGQLHIKQNKFGKKWKRSYALLYPDSPFGVARLEFYDWKDGTLAGEKIHTRKAADRKVVRLAECIRVVSAPAETGHKENMTAFIIETSDKTMLLSAERATCDEWVQRLSEVAFSGNSSDGKCSNDSMDSAFLEMAVNSIYLSREEVSEFRVTAQRTEAAERCSLRGSYILRAESDCLILKDATTKENLYSWPYKLLRRYGRDRVMFSFEAGRRCASGPGNFTFETPQGHEIFQKVESSIRAQQGPENRLSCPSLDTDIPTDITSQSGDTGRLEPHQALSLARKETEEKALKGRVLPNLPAVKTSQPQHLLDPSMSAKSSTPPRSPVHHHPADSEHMSVYSEPKDSVKGVKTNFDPLYSDPVDIVRGKEMRPEKDSVTSPLYSDLYERVSYEVVGGNVSSKAMSISGPPPGGEEHIYDEPEAVVQTSDPPQLYSEVRMEAAAWRKQSNDNKLGYEYPYNPDTDDYSVPNFQAQRNLLRNKTGPKPVPAPKPQVVNLTKLSGKERDPEKMQNASALSNSNNNNNVEALYSQVLKPGISKNPKPQLPLQPVINQDPSLPPLTTANQTHSTPPLLPANQTHSTSPLLPANQTHSTSPLLPANQTHSTPPLLPANQTHSTPPLLTANQTQSVPPLPPMNKYLGPPPLPPANKPLSIPPQPPSTKPQSVPPPPPAKPQSAKTQPLPNSQTSKALPSLPVPGKPQNVVISSLAESHLASDNVIGVSSGLQRDSSVIYEDMGIL